MHLKLLLTTFGAVTAILLSREIAQGGLLDNFTGRINDNWFMVDTNVIPLEDGTSKPWGPGRFAVVDGALRLTTSGPVPPLEPPMLPPDPAVFDTLNSGLMALGWGPSMVDPVFSNGRLRAKVRVDNPSNVDLALRTNPETFSGYVFAALGSYGQFHFSRLDNGAVTRDMLIPGVAFTQGEDWMMEFGADGGELSMKAWKASDAEPAAPQLTIRDDTYATGALGLVASVSTNNIAAPTFVDARFDDVLFSPNPPNIKVVSPNQYATQEGPGSNLVTQPLRYQQVYPATDFAAINGPHLITHISWRPDQSGGPATSTTNDAQLLLSVTSRGPADLSNAFAANIEVDPVTVFSGTMSLTTNNIDVPGGTKEFDQTVTLQTPFTYNPKDGNLLLEIVSRTPIDAAPRNDGFNSPSSSILAFDPNATSGGRLFGGLVTQFTLAPVFDSAPGDVNMDGSTDVLDIDALSMAVRTGVGGGRFDLNQDGRVDGEDRHVWIDQIVRTYVGDSNLDLEFNSTDLIDVLGAGQYEDAIVGNSTWSTGDWNGDGDFTSTDLITALADGGYEQGPRSGTLAVPEPTEGILLALGATGLLRYKPRRCKVQTVITVGLPEPRRPRAMSSHSAQLIPPTPGRLPRLVRYPQEDVSSI
jgi:hypothetical protein